jgi:hypothetical protein
VNVLGLTPSAATPEEAVEAIVNACKAGVWKGKWPLKYTGLGMVNSVRPNFALATV